jgi:hypothetical protein
MRRILTSSLAAGAVLAVAAPAALASHDPNPTIGSLTLGPLGTLSASGTITCPAPLGSYSGWDVSVNVLQRSGRSYASAGGFVSGACDAAEPKKWSLPLMIGSAPFKPGKVLVTVMGDSCTTSDEDPFQSDCASATLGPLELRLSQH